MQCFVVTFGLKRAAGISAGVLQYYWNISIIFYWILVFLVFILMTWGSLTRAVLNTRPQVLFRRWDNCLIICCNAHNEDSLIMMLRRMFLHSDLVMTKTMYFQAKVDGIWSDSVEDDALRCIYLVGRYNWGFLSVCLKCMLQIMQDVTVTHGLWIHTNGSSTE